MKLRRKPEIRGHPMKPLELCVMCDVCGRARSTGKHAACSKIRQQKYK